MTRRISTVALIALAALAFATAAVAATTFYAGPKQWGQGEGAGSGFSNGWHGNHFSTHGSGYDKAVTFIDNVRYSWHNTIRNRSGSTDTIAPGSLTVKGHCRAYDGYFWGSCWLNY